MPDIMEYKCPACGGAMEFDSKIQKMKCPYCDTEMSVEEFSARTDSEGNGGKDSGGSQWAKDETAGMYVYGCESCGGEIVAEESTGATTCPFCGNRVSVKEQFSGDLKPDYIIPFKKDKAAAKEAYYKYLEGKPFLPKMFKEENLIDEIKGVYVPFWLFDADSQADVTYEAHNTRVWIEGDREYTQHEKYRVQRSGRLSFERIPADGSRKMDDVLMESVEPYDFSEAVPFLSAYLAGYVADRYDVNKEERLKRVKERIKSSTEEALSRTVQGYDRFMPKESNVKISNEKYLYTLFPVWLLNTTWKGEKYTFAMNGQTGKVVGNLPEDKKAFLKYVISRGVIWGLAFYAVLYALIYAAIQL